MPTPDPAPPSADGTLCPNCGAVRRGRFCHSCGQREEVLRQPVHRVLADSFVEMFGLDGRVWRSFGVLLGVPGKLTTEFLAGRRMRYLRPLRLYLSATLLFFVLLSVLDPVGRIERAMRMDMVSTDSTATVAERLASLERDASQLLTDRREAVARVQERAAAQRGENRAGPGGTSADSIRADSLRRVGRAEAAYERDSTRLAYQTEWLQRLPPDREIAPERYHRAAILVVPDPTGAEGIVVDVGMGRLGQSGFLKRLRAATPGSERVEVVRELLRASIRRIPTVMFLILPLFALLLKLLYVRRAWYYSEHLIFALHVHAVAFVLFSGVVLLAVASAASAQALYPYLLLGLGAHFLLAQKRVYAQSWRKTIVKAVLLGWVYLLVLNVGLVAAIVIAAMFG